MVDVESLAEEVEAPPALDTELANGVRTRSEAGGLTDRGSLSGGGSIWVRALLRP
jgi:hypothetical protein